MGEAADDILSRRLLFVTGKGGVGKSAIAAGLALLGAQQGKRVLACEVDAKGNLPDFFEVSDVGFQPREVQPRLHLMSMNTEESLKEYLSLQLKLPLVARVGPLARTFDFIANAAPGVKEILTIGKLAHEVREQNYDLVVVDAVATGHIVGHLRAPEAINELVKVGLIRDQTDWMLELLGDPATTGVVVVTSPEEMPVTESLELLEALGETNVDVAAVVVNRVLPELFGRGEEEIFDALREPEMVGALSQTAGEKVGLVLEAARLAVRLRRTRTAHLTRLREGIDPTLPTFYIPELFTRSDGLRATNQLAQALGEEIGY